MFIDLLRETLGAEKNASEDIRFNCPFCGDEKYRLYGMVDEPYLWHCFKCDRKGNPVGFTMEFYAVPYHEAVEILKTYDYDVQNLEVSQFNAEYRSETLSEGEQILLSLRKPERQEDTKETLVPVPLPTGLKYLMPNLNNPEAWAFFNYLSARGFTLDQVQLYNMGYIIQGEVTLVSGKTLTLNSQVVFFTYDDQGQVQYWNTRSIEPNPFTKTFNAPARDGEYSKESTVFNLNLAKQTGRVIINEGVPDALTCGLSGVATFGKQVSDRQIELFKQASIDYPGLRFYVFLDRDAVSLGDRLAKKIHKFTDEVYLIVNTYGGDANSIGIEKVEDLIRKAPKYSVESSTKYILGI